MKKNLVIVLMVAALLVVGLVVQPFRILPAEIKEVDIYVGESILPTYFVRVVAGGRNTCWKPWKYVVLRLGNMVFVQVLTLHHRDEFCGQAETWEEKNINIGRCFIPYINWVVVNGEVETFIPHCLIR